MTTNRIALSTSTLLLFTWPAHAQQPSQASAGGGTVTTSTQTVYNGSMMADIHMSAPSSHAPAITGAPYSAEQVSEGVQTLADGTHITRKVRVSKLYRDSEGRTRAERPAIVGLSPNSPDVMIVEIFDPVSGFRYLLDTYNRVAHRFSPPEKGDEPARNTQAARPVLQATTSATVRQAPTAVPPRMTDSEVSSESLGTQVIEGVSAEGRRVTRTFAVGAVGNDRPIVSASESWYSPDLKMTVLSKNSDPRMGENTMRMQNIDRSEPDPALFRPPADYQLVDENSESVEIKIVRP